MSAEYNSKIKVLRTEIDEIDNELLELLSKRFGLVKEVLELKKVFGIKPLDKKRWNEVLENIKEKAKVKGISKKFTVDIWNIIHEEALRIEK